MKKGLMELIFILDKSGSMEGLEKDTIGGFNSMLKKQKVVDGDCNITTVLFDDQYELLHDRFNIKGIKPITEKEYQLGGSTALLDAIGKTLDKIINVQKFTAEEYKAEKVMFVIITDGDENSSKEYSAKTIKTKIKYQTENFGWEFVFLGANIDAVETAEFIGISKERACNFHADEEGISLNFEVMSDAIMEMRTNVLGDDTFEAINKDYKNRKNKIN